MDRNNEKTNKHTNIYAQLAKRYRVYDEEWQEYNDRNVHLRASQMSQRERDEAEEGEQETQGDREEERTKMNFKGFETEHPRTSTYN